MTDITRIMKERHPAKEANQIAFKVFTLISDDVSKFLLVGSLGRKEEVVGDIDILVIPKSITAIRNKLRRIGRWKKGGERQMSVEGIFNSPFDLDLFLCHPPAQWGVLQAVRLNPIPLVLYGKQILDEAGYTRGGGALSLDDVPIQVPTEEDWFKLVGIPYVPPKERWDLVAEIADNGSKIMGNILAKRASL